MEIVEFSTRSGLITHFCRINHQNTEAFIQDLRELSARKLKAACAAAEIEQANSKMATIEALAAAIAVAARTEGTGKSKKPKKEVKPDVAENAPPMVPQGLATESVQLKINPKYKKMVERPSPEQYEIIKHSIKTSGMKDKIQVLPDMTIWDGHTRYQICQELELPITSDDIEITDIPENKITEEVFIRNIARRQLSNYQKLKLFDEFMPKEEVRKVLKAERQVETPIAEQMVEQAEGKFLSNVQPPAEQKLKKGGTREKRAEQTGLPSYEIRRYDWCKRYIPKILAKMEEEQGADKLDINEVYAYGQEFWKAVKKWCPEEFEKVKAGELDLEEVNALAMQRAAETAQQEVAPERIPGPLEKLCINIAATYWKILEVKYAEQVTPDEFEADFIARLNVLTEKYQKRNA